MEAIIKNYRLIDSSTFEIQLSKADIAQLIEGGHVRANNIIGDTSKVNISIKLVG